ncbi:DMT family transporter [Ovoidimarina sediminis]|uniref:DMT family transporter n=1 Tax=Ovoidimarina sediminis TaxID=3079856 RepID=UPI0029078CF2|nr:DMT family transporter [Rhodophyticola sp. MJ-SS7]MDU8944738.1 DMT family transporter [Rhodophyticola sp. MJ-SS7]
MRVAALTLVVLVAFAANSILNRTAMAGGEAGPAAFATIRVVSGALALLLFAALSRQSLNLRTGRRPAAAAALLLYVLGFSFAYLTLDAGVGALILFGGVQVTMFAGALILGDRPPILRWAGMGLGLTGLCWLCWPAGAATVPLGGAVLMSFAALGWGIYSLLGSGVSEPLGETAGSFLVAAPVTVLVWMLSGEATGVTQLGWALAVVSGVVTSGLGYALWYSVLPKLDRSVAGLAQLSVPVIAVIGGALILGEDVTLRAVLAGTLVLAGVALGTLASRR